MSVLLLISCSEGSDPPGDSGSDTGANTGGASDLGASGGQSASGGATNSGGTNSSGGAFNSGGMGGSGGMTASGGATTAAGGDTASGGAEALDLTAFASELDGVFVDRPCGNGTSLPLANGAVCDLAGAQHVETSITFGGEPGTFYQVTLRVRGIWEPTKTVDGAEPDEEQPLMVGGQVEPGNGDSAAINYQQFYVTVASPAQTYWLNNYGYVAHDIHKADYHFTLEVEGGSALKVIANDGNTRQIANFPQESFADLPPYDKTPTLGQFLRLDVENVELAP